MTGFGLGEAPLGNGRAIVEVRAVNGRYLDVKVRVPRELADFCGLLEFEARKRLSRGRCEISVRTEGAPVSTPLLDKERAKAAYRLLVELRDEIAPAAEVPLSMLSSVPDLFRSPVERDFDVVGHSLLGALSHALDGLAQMREAEGAALACDLKSRLATVRDVLRRLAERAPEAVESHSRKLRERVVRFLRDLETNGGAHAGADASCEPRARSEPPSVDSARLEHELALAAERADISEELTRLGIHLSQMEEYVACSEPTGRRLDFLLQEMSREVNTIGAKSQDAVMAHGVVELKTEIDRMREQVQNVE